MSGSALLELTGVLRSDTGTPVTEGILLYRALAQHHRLVLVADDVSDERWLTENGLTEHAQLLVGRMDTAVQQARGKLGLDVRLVVSPSPATVAASMHLGLTSLLFAHPRFARPEFRDDMPKNPGTMREWDAIVKEISDQQQASTRTTAATE